METKEILDEIGMRRSMTRIAHEIIEHNKGVEDLVFVGIKTRGEILAKRLSDMIAGIENCQIPCYALDVSHWRDDLEDAYPIPDLEMPVKNKKFKGRTVRAAMDAIMHFGRANEIQLAVLVDRGHRELPIRADYIGKNIPSSLQEVIRVKVKEIDDLDGIYISK